MYAYSVVALPCRVRSLPLGNLGYPTNSINFNFLVFHNIVGMDTWQVGMTIIVVLAKMIFELGLEEWLEVC